MTKQPGLFGHKPGSNLPPAASDAFDRFWKAYPSRAQSNPRMPAEAAFAALVRAGVDAEILVQSAAGYATHCRDAGIAPLYRYEARNFLTRGIWRDHTAPDPSPPPASAPDGVIAEHFLAALGRAMDPVQWRVWIAPLCLHRRDGVLLAVVRAPGRFHAARVATDHGGAIKRALGVMRVEIRSQEDIHD